MSSTCAVVGRDQRLPARLHHPRLPAIFTYVGHTEFWLKPHAKDETAHGSPAFQHHLGCCCKISCLWHTLCSATCRSSNNGDGAGSFSLNSRTARLCRVQTLGSKLEYRPWTVLTSSCKCHQSSPLRRDRAQLL